MNKQVKYEFKDMAISFPKSVMLRVTQKQTLMKINMKIHPNQTTERIIIK